MFDFKFLDKNIEPVKLRANHPNEIHGFNMDEVCIRFLHLCYTRGLDFNRQQSYPLNLLNYPFSFHYITVENLTREFNPVSDKIIITYKISELNVTMPWIFTMEIQMAEFERRMLLSN